MSDLVRFGVAMERALLSEFDRRIATRGYENRSEALRDLVRSELTKTAARDGSLVAGTIAIVHAAEGGEPSHRLNQELVRSRRIVVSSSRLVLDETRLLEVLLVRGRADDLTQLAERLGGIKGVLGCELTVSATLEPAGDATPRGGSR